MSNGNRARRTEIKLYFKGIDISKDITGYLKSMTYTDNEEDKADDISITIDDRGGNWMLSWLNTAAEEGKERKAFKGTELHAVIIQHDFFNGSDRTLDCGTFEIDSVDYSGPPDELTIKATSIPYASSVRQTPKTKVWENISLKNIGNTIAENGGMEFMYLSDSIPKYKRKEQLKTSDIVFLKNLCKGAGLSLKVTSNEIIMFDALEFEKKKEIKELIKGKENIISYKLSTKTVDAEYTKCTVSYTDPTTKESISATYEKPGAGKQTQELKIDEKVNNKAEALELAKKYLRSKNKGETTAQFSLIGDVDYCAGVTVRLTGFGEFDGKYIVETATHSPTGGYKVDIKLRICMEDY